MPRTVTTPRQLDWNEIEELRQARALLTSRTKMVHDVYYLEGQQLIDVKLWLEEHMDDYPQWVGDHGSGFRRDFSREATAEELMEAEAVIETLSPFEPVLRATPLARDIITWRPVVQTFAPRFALDERPAHELLTTTTGSVTLTGNTNTFVLADEIVVVQPPAAPALTRTHQ